MDAAVDHISDALLLASLKRQVENERRRAMDAIEEIETFLASPSSGNDAARAQLRVSLTSYLAKHQTKRQAVLGAIIDKWSTVEEIANLTGLSPERVRGVLYASSLAGCIRKDRLTHEEGSLRFMIRKEDFEKLFDH